jgi:hypothetical protein
MVKGGCWLTRMLLFRYYSGLSGSVRRWRFGAAVSPSYISAQALRVTRAKGAFCYRDVIEGTSCATGDLNLDHGPWTMAISSRLQCGVQ